MNRLKDLIGPAPSERTKEELVSWLRTEHSRVSEGLATAAAYNAAKSRAKSSSSTKARMKQVDKAMELDKLCKKYGKTPEQIMKLLEEQNSG